MATTARKITPAQYRYLHELVRRASPLFPFGSALRLDVTRIDRLTLAEASAHIGALEMWDTLPGGHHERMAMLDTAAAIGELVRTLAHPSDRVWERRAASIRAR